MIAVKNLKIMAIPNARGRGINVLINAAMVISATPKLLGKNVVKILATPDMAHAPRIKNRVLKFKGEKAEIIK